MTKKCLAIFMVIITLLCLSACNNKTDVKTNKDSNNSNTSDKSLETNDDYNMHGNFQSSFLNMAIEGEWIFYSNYYDLRDGIKRTLVDGGEYSKYNIETVFSPNEHREEMAAKLGWNNSDFYEIEDIISINNLQVVNNWVYWASDCAIWRFPNMMEIY